MAKHLISNPSNKANDYKLLNLSTCVLLIIYTQNKLKQKKFSIFPPALCSTSTFYTLLFVFYVYLVSLFGNPTHIVICLPAKPSPFCKTPLHHHQGNMYAVYCWCCVCGILYSVGNIETSDRKQQMVTLKHFLNIINIYSTVCASVSN